MCSEPPVSPLWVWGIRQRVAFVDRPLIRVSALTSASRILGILTDIRGCLMFRPLESRLGQG